MRDLSLHLLDLTQNSVTAGASLVEILLTLEENGWLTMVIRDDGRGMSPELLARVTSPFATTRTTRKVGLGVPFFKMASEMAGGQFSIRSAPGEGTAVEATFQWDNVDRMPLGDMAATYCSLVMVSEGTDFVYTHTVDGRSFTADSREFRAVLEGVPLSTPDVQAFIRDYIRENTEEISGGAYE